MLMHDWIKYRNAQVKRAADQKGDADAETQQTEAVAKDAVDVAVDEHQAAAVDDAQGPSPDAESIDREKEELLESLQREMEKTGHSVRERLAQLQARQRQLPMDVEDSEETEDGDGSRGATETREDLVRRLLDPTLTLREASLLLDVCSTTVRRYTNRGLLNCYRTPGNQRRFRLSDILEFMERRDREEI